MPYSPQTHGVYNYSLGFIKAGLLVLNIILDKKLWSLKVFDDPLILF